MSEQTETNAKSSVQVKTEEFLDVVAALQAYAQRSGTPKVTMHVNHATPRGNPTLYNGGKNDVEFSATIEV